MISVLLRLESRGRVVTRFLTVILWWTGAEGLSVASGLLSSVLAGLGETKAFSLPEKGASVNEVKLFYMHFPFMLFFPSV